MPDPSSARSVKIDQQERIGWSSDRPRGDRPPRPMDVSVRGRSLRPSDRLRYAPGSLLVVVSPSAADRDAFIARVVEEKSAILSLARVEALLAGKLGPEAAAERAPELLAAAIAKRLDASESVVVTAGIAPEEREELVRAAATRRRPRHLVLLDAGRDAVAEEDRPMLNTLRQAIDGGGLGDQGFHTAMRLGGKTAGEVKKVVFRPEQADDE